MIFIRIKEVYGLFRSEFSFDNVRYFKMAVGSESPCRAELADPHSLFFNIIICGDFSKINII